MVSGKLPPEENCTSCLGLGFQSRLGLVLGLGGRQPDHCPGEKLTPRASFVVGG